LWLVAVVDLPQRGGKDATATPCHELDNDWYLCKTTWSPATLENRRTHYRVCGAEEFTSNLPDSFPNRNLVDVRRIFRLAPLFLVRALLGEPLPMLSARWYRPTEDLIAIPDPLPP
jgi:hypothetical protein